MACGLVGGTGTRKRFFEKWGNTHSLLSTGADRGDSSHHSFDIFFVAFFLIVALSLLHRTTLSSPHNELVTSRLFKVPYSTSHHIPFIKKPHLPEIRGKYCHTFFWKICALGHSRVGVRSTFFIRETIEHDS